MKVLAANSYFAQRKKKSYQMIQDAFGVQNYPTSEACMSMIGTNLILIECTPKCWVLTDKLHLAKTINNPNTVKDK